MDLNNLSTVSAIIVNVSHADDNDITMTPDVVPPDRVSTNITHTAHTNATTTGTTTSSHQTPARLFGGSGADSTSVSIGTPTVPAVSAINGLNSNDCWNLYDLLRKNHKMTKLIGEHNKFDTG